MAVQQATMHWQNGGLMELVHQHQEIIFSFSLT